MSPRPAAPSSASVSACAITSPSECPASPRGWSKRTPPSTSGTPSLERVRVDADADAQAHGAPRAARRASGSGSPPAAARADGPTGRGGCARRPCRRRAPGRRRCRRGRPRTRSSQAGPREVDTRSKNSGAGFATPQRADDPTHVDMRPQRLLRRTAACCRPRTTRARVARSRSRHGSASGYQSLGSQVAAGCSTPRMPPDVVVVLAARASAAEHAHQRERRHAGAAAARSHMPVSSTSVSPTSKTTASTATPRRARGRRASSP